MTGGLQHNWGKFQGKALRDSAVGVDGAREWGDYLLLFQGFRNGVRKRPQR